MVALVCACDYQRDSTIGLTQLDQRIGFIRLIGACKRYNQLSEFSYARTTVNMDSAAVLFVVLLAIVATIALVLQIALDASEWLQK